MNMYFANKICLNLALFQLKNALSAIPYCKIDGIKETEVETVSHYQMANTKKKIFVLANGAKESEMTCRGELSSTLLSFKLLDFT